MNREESIETVYRAIHIAEPHGPAGKLLDRANINWCSQCLSRAEIAVDTLMQGGRRMIVLTKPTIGRYRVGAE